MRVELISKTTNPLLTVYRAYKTCYSPLAPADIKPEPKEVMVEYIKDKIDRGHFSPLEQASFTFSISGITRNCAQQYTRQRTFRNSMQSQRYVNALDADMIIPEAIMKNPHLEPIVKSLQENTRMIYKSLVDNGIKKEDARTILPGSTVTILQSTVDLRNFRNFMYERQCLRAQSEIRQLCNLMTRQIDKNMGGLASYKNGKCIGCKDKCPNNSSSNIIGKL